MAEESHTPEAEALDSADYALRHAPAPGTSDVLAWLHAYSRWYHDDRQSALKSLALARGTKGD